ncbi:MAG: hypothetical protein NTU53_24320 [Planctomycetota bacterium]|nr:hypothetical protein [Planctomycetota bacterium]
MKKTRGKKTQDRRRRLVEGLEEDAAEEDPIFKPADLPHFQNGADNPECDGQKQRTLAFACPSKRLTFNTAAFSLLLNLP